MYDCFIRFLDWMVQAKTLGEPLTLDQVYQNFVKADVADEGLIKIMRSLAYNYIKLHGEEFNETL